MRRRGLRILFGVLGVVVVLVIAAVAVIATYDWNKLKPRLTETVSHALDREVKIDGDLTVHWQRDPALRGWRAWLPGPRVAASQVSIGNPSWAKSPEFAHVDRVEFDIDPVPLLSHTISIPAVQFVDPDVQLERVSDERNNWTFGTTDSGGSPWKFEFGRVQFARGQLHVIDRVKQLDVTIKLDALKTPVAYGELAERQAAASKREAAERVGSGGARKLDKDKTEPKPPRSEPEGYAFGWTAQGRMRGAEVKGEGRIGSVLALRNPERPFPLQADVHFGDTRVAFVGTLTDPRDLDALDLHLWLSGTTLSELYDVLGVTMPESGPYATSGQLIGNFRDATKLHYKNFTARVGESDLDGDLTYEVKKPRPLLSGKVVSNLLQFGDLAPLIGSSKKAAPQADQASSKVLPEEPFRPERWKVMDADVQFTGDRVFRDSELPIHKLVTRIVMKDAVLTLDPLRFRFAYGDVDGRIRMDGTNAPIKGAINGSARGVQLKHLFKTADSSQLDLGNANATIDLSASGNSVGALLGAANGEVKALLDGGSISKELVETAALNVPNIVLAKLVGDRQIRIGCAAADFAASNGVYNARLFIIDTDAAQINVTGDVDLAHERLDLVVHPDSKGLRLLSLRSPIHITGPFRKPDIGIDKGVLLARSAGAIGLAVVAAPAAALLPLTSTNLGNDQDHCTPLLNAIQQPVEKRAQGVQKSPAAR